MTKIPLWVEFLVWTPLGLYLYPKYYMSRIVPAWFTISNGILMGFYLVKFFNLIFN